MHLLPKPVIYIICEFLSNTDVANLRLVSKRFKNCPFYHLHKDVSQEILDKNLHLRTLSVYGARNLDNHRHLVQLNVYDTIEFKLPIVRSLSLNNSFFDSAEADKVIIRKGYINKITSDKTTINRVLTSIDTIRCRHVIFKNSHTVVRHLEAEKITVINSILVQDISAKHIVLKKNIYKHLRIVDPCEKLTIKSVMFTEDLLAILPRTIKFLVLVSCDFDEAIDMSDFKISNFRIKHCQNCVMKNLKLCHSMH